MQRGDDRGGLDADLSEGAVVAQGGERGGQGGGDTGERQHPGRGDPAQLLG
ncbi:hypothetical protein [Micromonospora sp. NPDC049240]|uniref:hypothetical protein n=1 Tax=Micromonospora sp. NPDC049240 TaxID=3155151 RepID=UPI0034099728